MLYFSAKLIKPDKNNNVPLKVNKKCKISRQNSSKRDLSQVVLSKRGIGLAFWAGFSSVARIFFYS